VRPLILLALLVGCAAPVEPAAVWLRGVGPFGEDHEMIGNALVVASPPDFCERFRERWSDYAQAWLDRNEALAEAGDDPEAGCEAVLQFWRDRADAERKLWFRNASYLKVFRSDYRYWPSGDPTPTEVGRVESGVTSLNDPGKWVVTSQAAHRLPAEPWDIEPDCSIPLVQNGIGQITYPGPPREHWRASAGRMVVEKSESSWAISIDGGQLEFDHEISYRVPTEDDPEYVVEDREPRDPIAFEIDRQFERCDVEVDESQWWSLLGWATGDGW